LTKTTGNIRRAVVECLRSLTLSDLESLRDRLIENNDNSLKPSVPPPPLKSFNPPWTYKIGGTRYCGSCGKEKDSRPRCRKASGVRGCQEPRHYDHWVHKISKMPGYHPGFWRKRPKGYQLLDIRSKLNDEQWKNFLIALSVNEGSTYLALRAYRSVFKKWGLNLRQKKVTYNDAQVIFKEFQNVLEVVQKVGGGIAIPKDTDIHFSDLPESRFIQTTLTEEKSTGTNPHQDILRGGQR
jgi:hypothetical protein